MIGFYVIRCGQDYEKLINLSETEKAVFMLWMKQYYDEEVAKYKVSVGGK